jgi:4-amino-4-deoxy-L-arabinose transferase-like glycosyltransferase
VSYLAIGLVALLLRVLDLGGYLTVDEATTWVPNSYRFLRVLQTGEYADTPFMGHPAITTMWLGSAGVALRRAVFAVGLLHHETYALTLMFNRLPFALVTTLGILLAYWMLRRLFPANIAALAAFLWATDPFLIAFSRVIHMDALMATFATLSLLAASLYWYRHRHMMWLIASAICAGLAVLSKLPALGLFPVIGLMALSFVLHEQQHTPKPLTHYLLPLAIRLGVWGIVVLITVVALWPTFWESPIRAFEAMQYGAEVEGGNPHMMGNFFLGEKNEAPGIRFYPVALAMRTTPWSLLGLFLLPFVWHRGQTLGQTLGPSWREIGLLAGWTVVFVAAMSIFPLKFNRYLVPVFPSVDILAAVGLVWGAGWLPPRLVNLAHFIRYTYQTRIAHPLPNGVQQLWQRLSRLSRLPRFSGLRRRVTMQTAPTILLSGVMLVAAINAFWYHPYSITYFNQALGGAQAGVETFLAGWGEGLDQVADWLNEQPDITSVVTVSRLDTLLNPYLKEYAYATRREDGELPDQAGYLVVYFRHMQWGQLPPPYRDFFYGPQKPLHIVNLHGVEYAWIYQVPRSMPKPLDATFGDVLGIHGYDIETSALRETGALTLTLQWHAHKAMEQDYSLFVHVFDEQGERVAQLDVPLLNPHEPTSAWQAGRYYYWVHPVPIPNSSDILNTPDGRIWISLGVYDPNDPAISAGGARLPFVIRGKISPNTPDDGAHALFLEPLTLNQRKSERKSGQLPRAKAPELVLAPPPVGGAAQ